MPLFLGIDAGGSTTRTVVVDTSGAVVFEGRGGPANLLSTPPEIILDSLASALLGAPRPDAAVAGFAGLVDGETARAAQAILAQALPALPVAAVPDFEAALAVEEGADAVVVAGTGSLVATRIGDRVEKWGAGGPMLGDRGSAFDVVRTALQATCLDRSYAGTEAWWAALESAFGSRNPDAVVAAFSRDPVGVATLASLAPVVGADAEEGEPYATAALRRVGLLRNLVDRAAEATPIMRVALFGGLWRAHPVFARTFAAAPQSLKVTGTSKGSRGRQYEVVTSTGSAALGAARLAARAFYGH